MSKSLQELKEELRVFIADRDWEKFHSPKNLTMALAGEAGELLEQFQWLTEEESYHLAADKKVSVGEEIADILIYLVRLADELEIDLLSEAFGKIEKNAVKYPVEKVRGKATKYTDL
ncbi:MAG: nucleotide pyrophosphohydrolase [Opitutales bacterium]|nr:nucleotide pyrophosphohydrolase [Opitutales bacterium]